MLQLIESVFPSFGETNFFPRSSEDRVPSGDVIDMLIARPYLSTMTLSLFEITGAATQAVRLIGTFPGDAAFSISLICLPIMNTILPRGFPRLPPSPLGALFIFSSPSERSYIYISMDWLA